MTLSGTLTGLGTAPAVIAAVAPTSAMIRVDFSEELDASTLIVANFTLTANGGADARTIVAVTPVGESPTSVILTLDDTLSSGLAAYTLEVDAAVTDLAGNAMDPALDSADVDVPGTPSTSDVSSEGGETVSAVVVATDGDYYVDVGVDPEVSAVRAYSGVPGQGAACSLRDGVIAFVVPVLEPAEGYRALLTPVGGGATVLTGVLFHARRRPLFSATFALRSALPASRWAVGPTDPAGEVVA